LNGSADAVTAAVFCASVPEGTTLVITERQEISVSPGAIEFWFEFGSNYSCLSVMRIEQLAARLGVTMPSRR